MFVFSIEMSNFVKFYSLGLASGYVGLKTKLLLCENERYGIRNESELL